MKGGHSLGGSHPSSRKGAPAPSISGLVLRARELHAAGRLADAEPLYRTALAAEPDHSGALHLLGVLKAQLGDLETAISLIERAAAIDPRDPAIPYNLANAFRDSGRKEDAVAAYGRTLAIDPANSRALTNRGAVLFDLGRFADALADYDRALATSPQDASTLNNRGNALLALERYADALASYERALGIRPDHVDALFGRGKALTNLDRIDEALDCFARVLALRPHHAEAAIHRGHLFIRSWRFQEALAAFDKAIAAAPNLAAAHRGRAQALFELRRGEEAAAAYDRAFSLDPEAEFLEGMRFLTKLYICDWSDFESERARLVAHVVDGKRAADPFAFLVTDVGAPEQLRCARTYAAARYPSSGRPLWRGERYGHKRIRVGYVSGEFREQATAHLVAELFECHDRRAFEIHGISTGIDDGGAMRQRIEKAFDVFLDASRLSDLETAEAVHAAELDILVDLNGYFGAERTGLFALMPSPLQVNYLGFPGSMGAPYMDYILADRWVIPEDQRRNYMEKVVYLPVTYQANDRKKSITARPQTRTEHGLPRKGFVFSCFNNAYKITPDIFDIWMRLLSSIEGSVLWLLETDKAAKRNLAREAAQRGVSPERLVFAPFLPLADHLARSRLADLFLDTAPVNAHTTASDALWAGVPVLTVPGRTFAGRVAASLLHAAGLEETIAGSLAEYEALALHLARDRGRLEGIRTKLAQGRHTCPLFDTPRLTRDIEAAYRTMWERHERGEEPAAFSVDS